jgi:predicted nuclease with TOPRIM domain
MINRIFEHLQKPSTSTTLVGAEKLRLDDVLATVRSLHEKWPKHSADLSAVHEGLNTVKTQLSQLDQRSSRLTDKLSRWIDRYQKAWKIAQDCIYFQSWLSAKLPQDDENWPALAQEVYCFFSPIRSSYKSYATDLKDTQILSAKRAEILDTLDHFKRESDHIEANRALLQEGGEDEKCRQAFRQIRDSATKMANCSIDLCQCLHSAIQELVNEMSGTINVLKKL